ncbi:AraC family transcriptional regulator [Novosphingobium endophyticum]|uniref:AraC family transcriptional regulator n=1 Tax=Novosphingobium endophyticum TaxID=1955250 RepID=A0A916TSZ8_9SPHN|nr:AraC family transcriptional regulator [Novosphingobium endophyticum]GGC04732.1 AraC family transcriptional regulator [Novosphingobium endophyticum]
MDALSDVLRIARLKGGVFLHAEFTEPWCIAAQMVPELCAPFMGPVEHLIPYHYVVEGELLVRIADGDVEPVRLGAGEVVLVPHNDVHLMGSAIRGTPVPAGDIICPPQGCGLFSVRHGGGGKAARVVCGFLGCDGARNNPVLSTLPPLLVLNVDEGGGAEWIRSTFQFAADEVASGRPGSEAVLSKLSELLFVEAIRRYSLAMPEGQTGWLAGLRDPYVSRAVALFHGDLARPWTIDDLAREVGLSRSALAERFVRLLGVPPIQYLANWRMQVASQELRNTAASLAQIANVVGYDSEAAFSRAFKRAFGSAPASWRKSAVSAQAA